MVHFSIQLYPVALHPLQHGGKALQILSMLAASSSLSISLELTQVLFSLHYSTETTFTKATNDLQATKFNGQFLVLISLIYPLHLKCRVRVTLSSLKHSSFGLWDPTLHWFSFYFVISFAIPYSSYQSLNTGVPRAQSLDFFLS